MKKLFVVLLILLLTSCSTTSKQSTVTAKESSTFAWSKCHRDFQCAVLTVPIDYSNKSLGNFEISVIRYRDPSQHNRLGSLVINPGGPGSSGVEYALNAEFIISPEVLERYDIIGFDPRGIGSSTPIHCLDAKEQDAYISSDPKPGNDAEFDQAIKDTQEFVNKCVAHTPNISHFSTQEAAHDMELLRIALGDKKLNYLGFSYGTYLGTLYAQQFPTHVGRFVLDGAIDPSISIDEQALVQATAFDKALSNFITDCHKQQDCTLPADATGQYFIDLFKKISIQPLKADNRLVTEGMVVTATAAALYDDVEGWPMLIMAINEARDGDGTTFAKLADAYNGRETDGSYISNENDANVVIDCLDWNRNKSNEQIRTNISKFAKAAPVLGPYIALSGITCNELNKVIGRAPNSSNQNTVQISKTATKVLIIGTTQDPATPYAWAKALHSYIHNSRLITLKAEGHTGYGRGSACTDDAVDSYLLTGIAPRKDLNCTQ